MVAFARQFQRFIFSSVCSELTESGGASSPNISFYLLPSRPSGRGRGRVPVEVGIFIKRSEFSPCTPSPNPSRWGGRGIILIRLGLWKPKKNANPPCGATKPKCKAESSGLAKYLTQPPGHCWNLLCAESQPVRFEITLSNRSFETVPILPVI